MKHFIAILTFVLLLAGGCTSNQMARGLGGSAKVALKPCERLEMVTWKHDSLWLLTSEDCAKAPKTYTFKEDSSWGLLEGNVTIIEK